MTVNSISGLHKVLTALICCSQVREELSRGLSQRAVARAIKLVLGPPTPDSAKQLPAEPSDLDQASLAGYLAS